MGDGKGEGYSLADFPEYDPTARLASPRSLRACAKEGIDPKDLAFRAPEDFAEKKLSPRLVKLRYDFFEAKRKDLLAAARRARSGMIAKGEKAPPAMQTSASTSIVAAASALDSDTIRLEKSKLARVQQLERKWLEGALGAELAYLKHLESSDQALLKEAGDEEDRLMQASMARKAASDAKREAEHQKALEAEAQQQLERELAKQEFMRQQEENRKAQEKMAQQKREQHKRAIQAAEAKREAEREKQRAQERAWQRQQERLVKMEESDAERSRILAEQKEDQKRLFGNRAAAKHARIQLSIDNNMEIERQKEQDFQDRCLQDMERQNRLDEEKHLFQEMAAKRSLQLQLKRKNIADESSRKLESRRQELLDHQDAVDRKLAEHDSKKERYLEFKRELDGLKDKNKELNVDRMRRRMDHRRDVVAETCRQKTTKGDMMMLERERLWNERRQTALLSQMAREKVKETILNQRIKSKFSSAMLQNELSAIFNDKRLNPKMQHSSSLPNLA